MNPACFPVACELFAQWQRARGGRTETASRPFSRGWEDLLEDARIVSAGERSEAERDARSLETEGWVELKSARYRPHLIDRVLVPLAAEARWREAFGFVAPSDEEARQIREFPWEPRLAFVRDARLNVSFAELRQLNEFLKNGGSERRRVPIKERSLQIFGDEKRLDALLSSALFRPGRLDEKTDLHCEVIGVPLAWQRGPTVYPDSVGGAGDPPALLGDPPSGTGDGFPLEMSAQSSRERLDIPSGESPDGTGGSPVLPALPLIVIENAATWHSFCRWNLERNLFSGVIYGDGNRFVDGIRYLAGVFEELGGPRRVLYFGDLDPPGLLIPQEASFRAQANGLPIVEPHLWSYRQLLTLGAGLGQPWEGELPSPSLCDWLGDLAEQARQLFAEGHRLAQEHVGWEFLRARTGLD